MNVMEMDHSTVLAKSVKVKHLCRQSLEYPSIMMARLYILNTCHPCQLVVHKTFTPGKEYKHRTTRVLVASADMLRAAAMCEHYNKLQKGGRPRKLAPFGCPPSASPRYCGQHVKEIAPQALVDSETTITICQTHQVIDPSQLHCLICCNVLCSPIELVTCGTLVCAQCCC